MAKQANAHTIKFRLPCALPKQARKLVKTLSNHAWRRSKAEHDDRDRDAGMIVIRLIATCVVRPFRGGEPLPGMKPALWSA